MSILTHPEWPLVKSYIYEQLYGRDWGPNGPRARLECRTPSDGREMRRLLAIRMPCVTCQQMISPIRARQDFTGLYYTPTCSQDISIKCSRSPAARKEYLAVRAALRNMPPTPKAQPMLF